jgi:exopolyphosphatase/guanosine-5'-triphosphate,3'-diphosphate pyrophosphatase
MAKRVAVIDIGSNSARMVIYEKSSRFAFRILHEAKSRVRLSENAYKNNGNIQEIPMRRAYDALYDFLSIINSFQARKILCVATSALRDAPNKSLFINRVKKELGINIKVINGEREAYLGAIACANLLPEQNSAISIDIGGGSTEFAVINKQNITANISLDLGTVRLKELFFDNNDIKGASKYIDTQLEKLSLDSPSTIIGIGGTFRALSNALLHSTSHPLDKLHAYEPSYNDFSMLINNVLNANEDDLKKLGIKSSRFDVIKPGALILSRVLKKFKIRNLTTSGVGVREGVYLADLLRNSKDRFPRNFNTSIRYILDKHIENKTYANQINKVAKELFDLLHNKLKIDEKYRYELSIAAKLCTCGSNIHFYSEQKHSYSIIEDSLEFGFDHKQIALISTLCKFANKKLPTNEHYELFKSLLPNAKMLSALSYILSLSIALLTHRPRNIDFSLKVVKNELVVESKKPLYLTKDAVEKLNSFESLNIVFVND